MIMKKFKIRIHKRTIVIVLTILLFLTVIFGVVFLVEQIWNDYQTSYNKHFDSAKTDINNVILVTSTGVSVTSADKLNNIVQIQAKLTGEIDSYCKISPVIEWQSFIGRYSDKMKDCTAQKDHLSQLLSKIKLLTGYLKSEQALAAIILTANTQTNQNNQVDKWANIEAFWLQAVTSVSKLPDTDQFKSVKKLAISELGDIASAWGQLSSQDKSENRQQFEAAQSNLATAYAALSKISDADQLETKKLITDLNNSY